MNDSKNNVINITILDRTYKIKCMPSETKELQASAQYVDAQMRKIRQSSTMMNTDRVAIVTALNISNELLQLKQKQNQSQEVLNQRLQDIRDRVKNTLAIEEEIAV